MVSRAVLRARRTTDDDIRQPIAIGLSVTEMTGKLSPLAQQMWPVKDQTVLKDQEIRAKA